MKKRVLILCTGNSCRSQMAEGWVRHDLGDRWEVASAGTHPAWAVHPLSVRVMSEAGVDISAHAPKHWGPFLDEAWDLVVTVCDSARESCPVFPGAADRIHVSFPDPILAEGSEEERLAAYRAVRDDIRARLIPEIARRAPRPNEAVPSSGGGERAMAEVMSGEWASEWCRALNASERFRTSAASWEGALLVAVRPDAARGIEPRAVLLDLWHGACRAGRPAGPDDADAARYALTASAATWMQVLSGALDPLAAVMTGALELTKGSITSLLPYVAAAKELMAVARALPASPPVAWKIG